jgi:hypothetical protein
MCGFHWKGEKMWNQVMPLLERAAGLENREGQLTYGKYLETKRVDDITPLAARKCLKWTRTQENLNAMLRIYIILARILGR